MKAALSYHHQVQRFLPRAHQAPYPSSTLLRPLQLACSCCCGQAVREGSRVVQLHSTAQDIPTSSCFSSITPSARQLWLAAA